MPSVSRPSGPKNEGTGQNAIMDQQRSRAAVTPTTTEQVPAPEQPVTGCLYEAGFSTTGPHPQGGVAIARSIDDARQRLADMLIFCDPTAAAVADITAFTPTPPSPGTAGPSRSCSPTSTPAPRTALSLPAPSSALPPHAPRTGGDP